MREDTLRNCGSYQADRLEGSANSSLESLRSDSRWMEGCHWITTVSPNPQQERHLRNTLKNGENLVLKWCLEVLKVGLNGEKSGQKWWWLEVEQFV